MASAPRSLAAVLSLVLALTALPAASAAVFPTRVEGLRAPSFPAVEASVTVWSKEPLKRLATDDFIVTEDGRPVAGFDVALDPRPLYVTLVLDRSGSMTQAMPFLKRAAFSFLDGMGEDTFCRLSSFADDVRTHTGFSNSAPFLRRRVAELEPFGATRLFDALGDAVAALDSYPDASRRVVVAFTDGVDQTADRSARLSTRTARDVALAARQAGVPLYLVGLGSEVNRSMLERMAQATGGSALFTTDPRELASVFDRLSRSLEQTYRVAWTSPNPRRDGTVRAVQVVSREAGSEEQGSGRYRAPADPAPVGRPAAPASGAPVSAASPTPDPTATLARVLGTMTLPRMGLGFDRDLVPLSGGGRLEPVRMSCDTRVDAAAGLRMTNVTGTMGDGSIDCRYRVEGPRSWLSITPPSAPVITVAVDPRVSVTGPSLAPISVSVPGLLIPLEPLLVPANDAVDLARRVSAWGEVRRSGPGSLTLTSRLAGGPTAKISYDTTTFRPTVVTLTSPSGASSTTRVTHWLGDTTVPSTPPPAPSAGVDPAAALLFAGRVTAPLTVDLGGLAPALDGLGASIQAATDAGLRPALASIEAFNRSFALWSRDFSASMQKFSEDLTRQLAENQTRIEADMARFAESMARFHQDLDADVGRVVRDAQEAGRAGREAGERAREAGERARQAGERARLAGQAARRNARRTQGRSSDDGLDAARQAVEDAAEDVQDAAEAAQDASEAYDDAMDAANEAMDAAGSALDGVSW